MDSPKNLVQIILFKYCFSWDNTDDSWDSFDKEELKSMNINYKHSACWNKGNSDVFVGKYDYNNGKALDKNMWTKLSK